MNYDQFVGQVHHRARLATSGEAVAAIRATFQTLAERLPAAQVAHIAAQLPRELQHYLLTEVTFETDVDKFDMREFFARVAVRGPFHDQEAERLARAVLDVLKEAVSPGLIRKLLHALPESWSMMFFPAGHREELATAGQKVPIAAGDPAAAGKEVAGPVEGQAGAATGTAAGEREMGASQAAASSGPGDQTRRDRTP